MSKLLYYIIMPFVILYSWIIICTYELSILNVLCVICWFACLVMGIYKYILYKGGGR
jgi:hypothetical protein